MTSPTPSPAEALADALRAARRRLVVAVTGAGVSAGSGLPTFRSGPDAVWRQDDLETGTEAFFRARPVDHWRWYLDRFSGILEAEPNPAHHALAALEQWQVDRGGRFLLVTQNIDTLHEQAGSEDLIKVHGTADRFRCSREGCRLGPPSGSIPRAEVDVAPFERRPSRETVPRCSECGALLRAHALFFDEYYDGHADYGFERVRRAFEEMALALFAGTSFSVGVTELALRSALFRKVPAYSVDPAAAAADHPLAPALHAIPAPAEDLLPEVCELLGVEIEETVP